MESLHYCVICKKEIIKDVRCLAGDIIHQCILISREEFNKKSMNTIEVQKDMVNHPSHYGRKDNVYEVIKIIKHYNLGFCIGNSIKYILRAGKKDENKYIEDLEKAKWYLEEKINELKNSK